ncbi:MAG TPA: DUF3821 domain-containing protein [Methanospirillum sp.]|nr:DUF3821 domain-containing protein [Methanospirillum sp.]
MRSILKRIVACILLLCLLGGAAAVTAEEAKQLLPMFLEGNAYVGATQAPPDATIRAYINGTFAGEALTISDGAYGTNSSPMMVQVGPDETLRGAEVSFQMNGVLAPETTTYEPGTTQILDLHFPEYIKSRLNVVHEGNDVFLGEEGLDVSQFLSKGDTIVWFDRNSDVYQTEPVYRVSIDNPTSFFIDPSDSQFGGRTGWWWNEQKKTKAFIVKDPSMNMRIWNLNENEDIQDNNLKIPAGNNVAFKVETNLYSVLQQRAQDLPDSEKGIINIAGFSNVTKIDYKYLKDQNLLDIPLRGLVVDSNPWWWYGGDTPPVSSWYTGAVTNGDRYYPNGQYLFYAEINASLNNIKKNYRDEKGNYYVGKTVSAEKPAEIVDEYIDVKIDRSEVVRNQSFFVTVTGRKGTEYVLTIMECPLDAADSQACNAQKMTGEICDRPPIIRSDQSGVAEGKVQFDAATGPFPIGDTDLVTMNGNCGGQKVIRDTVPTDDKPWAKNVVANGVNYYAKIVTDSDLEPKPGQRTIEVMTGSDVAPDRSYRIHVQSVNPDCKSVITGDAMVKVVKGEVTMNIYEQPPFYLGSDITLSGKNTDSKFVYLFMTGSQCQNKCGNDLLGWKRADETEGIIQPFIDQILYGCVEEAEQFTTIQVPVKSDGTWEYIWRTQKAPINPGTYTIYASSQPINACCLDCGCAAVAFQDIVLEEPCLSGIIDPALITKPIECCPTGCEVTSLDTITLTGEACGFPHIGDGKNSSRELNMWIFGEEKVGNDKYINARIPVYDDDTYKANLLNYISLCNLKPGNYTVIIQHPMYNNKFDLVKETDVRTPIDSNQVWMVTSYPDEWSKLFPLEGPGFVQGSQAISEIKKYDDQNLIDDKFLYLSLVIVDDRVPTAAFEGNPTQGSAPLEVQFTDQSTGSNLNSWYWEFGDGTTATEVNPKHTYSETGEYTVSLTVMNSDGSKDTATKPGYIKVRTQTIKADFVGSPTSGAAPLKVQFNDLSTGSPNNWFWDFGDGFTAAGVKDPAHTYQYGGNYTVTLTTTLGQEVDRKIRKDYIRVLGGPNPTYTPSPIDPTKIQLYSGWNFISVARALTESSSEAGTIFKNVPTGGHAIWSYDPYGQFWDQVLTGTTIQTMYGYWIYAVTPYTVNLTFKNDPVQIPPQRNLPSGWAAVGFTGGNPAPAKDTFSSVKDAWIYARGFDNAHQQWEPTMVNGGQGENTYLYPSKGYWLYMEKPGTLAAIGV